MTTTLQPPAGLPAQAQAQLAAHAERVQGGCWGKPHSENPSSAAGISIRTGCHCNPGASERASLPTGHALRAAARARPQTMDQYINLLGLPSGGALRASVGLASNVDDVQRFLVFVHATYTDRGADTRGLAPRRGC